MAVQAQYPSNFLLLNRNVQEGDNPIGNNDYSFIDQSQMIFSNGVGSNTRKRGRESPNTIVDPFSSVQLNPPQFIDLTQLQTPSQPNAVSTGLRLAFGEQQQPLQPSQPPQQRKPQQQQQQTLSPQSPALFSLLSEHLATQIRQQREEIEQFIQAQGEQLRRTLADKSQRHYRALLCAAEESASRKLREKEAEVDKAARRNAELEARAAQLAAQTQAWQARARAQEATAAALQEQLQRAIIVTGSGGAGRGKEVECGGGEAEDAESVYVDPERVGPSCRACGERVASVVVLPCRHLCLCTECGVVAQSCPLCLAFRESSVEIFLS